VTTAAAGTAKETDHVGRWRILEDVAVADCALDLEARDVHDLFETAALALVDLMVDPSTVAVDVERVVTLDAAELDLLLYDWLSELIFLKDRDRQVFTSCRVRVGEAAPYHLRAELRGGTIESGRTALRADLKAVTLHQFALERGEDGWRARVVIDI
jgi:SHS2 domain-containing protein